jgi:alpha-galactosidase
VIKLIRDIVKIDTQSTTMLLKTCAEYVEPLYYGERLADASAYAVFGDRQKPACAACDDLVLCPTIFSATGDGNASEPFVIMKNADGSFVNRFTFSGVTVCDGGLPPQGLPAGHCKAATAVLTYTDEAAALTLTQYFSVYEGCDAVSVGASVTNNGKADISVRRLMSLQLDFVGNDFEVCTFNGAWARERHQHVQPLAHGIFVGDSKGGSSSNLHNPFFVLSRKCRAEAHYAFNLLYSGNHKEMVEVTKSLNTRVLCGMSDYLLDYTLHAGQTLHAPEAVVTFAATRDEITLRMHRFVKDHVLPPRFAGMPRPVLLNSWEAAYFNFDKERLLTLARCAAAAGTELFVLDDGWFGSRNDDTQGLGDWHVENPRVGAPLAQIVEEIKALGLQFGLWIEPEMVSRNSRLFEAHPDWVMQAPSRIPTERRCQLMLDLTNPAVCRYLTDTVLALIDRYGLDYIKWDYNRNMSDMFGATLDNQGEYFYRYTLGLYEILTAVTEKRPRVLIEACASGGNRYDLGMLSYVPQIWVSDNTDAHDRVRIQEGTLCGYPPCTAGAHVSASPNHQTGNSTSIENRFNVAAVGAFGYELNLLTLFPADLAAVRAQIVYYKEHRALLQFGDYYALDSAFQGDLAGWIAVSRDKREAIACVIALKKQTNHGNARFRLKGLAPDVFYRVTERPQANADAVPKCFTAQGAALMSLNVNFGDLFADTDREQNANSIGSRMFYLDEC